MLQFIVNGLIQGILYSLLAIGFSLVYNTTKVFHIAAAGIYTFAAYMFYTFSSYLPMFLAALVAIVLAMGLSLLTELTVYRPLWKRKASNNVAMIASIGMMTVIVNALAMHFGNDNLMVNTTVRHSFFLGNIIITTPQMWELVVGMVVIAAFLIFINIGDWGVRFRALSVDAGLYETMGYNTTHTRTAVFLMSGAFLALGSCLTVFDVGFDPNVGMNAFINAMVAMIIGGVGRFGACVVGGLALGILQALVVSKLPSSWQEAVSFVVLLIMLFVRPQGIAGYEQRTV